ncbi:MAG: S-layer homology domain-containing protein [Chloroflexota bacterium]
MQRSDRPTAQEPEFKPAAPIGFALDDGYAETSYGFGNDTYNYSAAAIWLNRFSIPGPVPYPLTLTGMQILFPGFNSGNFVGDTIQLVIYLDVDGDGNPANASLIYQAVRTISVADWNTFQYFPISAVVNTRGDLYVGWEDKWAESGPSPLEYVAATDETHSQHRSWLIANTVCCSPNIYNLGANDYRYVLDDLGPGGNLMVRLLADSYTPATPTSTPTNLPVSTPTTPPTLTPTNTATPVPPRCPGERFTDVCPGDYFYEPVLSLNDAGIVSGYNTAPPCITGAHIPCYLPYNNVTRGQSAKIVALSAGFTEPVSGQLFEDIPPGSTFYEYVQRLANRSIVSGYPCGGPSEPCGPANLPYFRQNSSVTRGQLSKMISQAFGYSEVASGQTFEDVAVGSTFYPYIQRMADRGIINGYPCGSAGEPCIAPGNRPYFRPGNPVTRGQTAKMLYIARSLVQPTPTLTPTMTATLTATTVPTASSTYTTTPAPTETALSTVTPTTSPTETSTQTTVPTATETAAATSTQLPTATATSTPGLRR